MSNVWSAFDNGVNTDQLQKEVAEAYKNGNFSELPADTYNVEFTTIEAGLTKKDKRPMLKIAARVLDGKYKKRLMFMNRVLMGTKNDKNMIASAIGWLANLEAEDETGDLIIPVFRNYDQFADLVMDIAEAVEDMGLNYEVKYDPDAFNTISIIKVLD